MKILSCFLLFTNAFSFAFAQNDTADSLLYTTALANVESCYKNSAGANSMLYNGPQYSSYVPRTKGHAYYLADSLMQGSIHYNGIVYRDLKIKYDLVQAKLVLYDFNNSFLVSPGEEKVDYFFIGDHLFEKIYQPLAGNNGEAHGFFEKIYSGKKVSVYAKWEKYLFQPVKAEDSLPFYKEYTTWYMSKEGILHEVTGKRSVLKILEDKKQELKGFVAAGKIANMDSEGLRRIAAWYESVQ